MTRDVVFGSAAFVVAVTYYLLAATIPASLLADAIGPQGMPKTYAVLLAGLSLILIARSVRLQVNHDTRLQPDPAAAAVAREPAIGRNALWRVAGLLAIGVAYVVVVPWLGYMLSLAALIMATTYYQGGALNRQVVIVALSGAVVFWLLFVVLLGIPQPAGLWPSLL
jgi:putative tricarboxylic transport membrane protein